MHTRVCIVRIQFDPGACNGARTSYRRKRWQPRSATRTNAQHHYLERCLARGTASEEELVNLRASRVEANAPDDELRADEGRERERETKSASERY